MSKLVLWTLWADFGASIFSIVYCILKSGQPRPKWPTGISLVMVVACNTILAYALWVAIHR